MKTNSLWLALASMLMASGAWSANETSRSPAVPPEATAKSIASIALVNAGFESTRPGKLGAPDGWWAIQHAGPPSYRFTLDESIHKTGARSMRVENIGPEPYGTIFQYVDAHPYRGKTVRAAGWIRTEKTSGNQYGAGAGLHLQTQRRGHALDTAPMLKNAIAGTTDWTRYELVLSVADEADRIEVGLNLYGPGVAWLDDMTLDVVEAPKSKRSP
ncbi:MAG TPA: hypothetical protein VNG69_16770 [Casimicrobiaceae bacterium]|nr:hypothetical protein [Casimicrobiaceae bacterium]